MGTHSLIRLYSEGKLYAVLYQQFDGDIHRVGHNLARFILSKKLVNGISDENKKIANGVEDLFLMILVHFKGSDTSSGGAYLYPPDAKLE